MTVLVTGGGGFIGGHLIDRRLRAGRDVRVVDIKPTEEGHQVHESAEHVVADSSDSVDAQNVTVGARDVCVA